jgi:hypothetical protein
LVQQIVYKNARREFMKLLAKFALVLAGYVAAGSIATLAVVVNQAFTPSDGSDGMYAFGDVLLFVAVFGFVAAVWTVTAIYFIRSRRS